MSGATVPYHLRQNKAIERNLFIELLAKVGRVRNISEYEYIGFGGPFMEDHKALHASLRMCKMHSIERDANTYARQQFNYAAKFITSHHKESGEFFREHNFGEKGTVVWLDYTSAETLNEQLNEFHAVVAQLGTYDVAKITLNASVLGLGLFPELGETKKAAERLKVLQERIPNYVPIDLTDKDLFSKNYPKTLQRCVKNSLSALSVRHSGLYFHPLSSFWYADGQTMLTITGMVFKAADDSSVADFVKRSRLEDWPFANLKWETPTPISVPALSAKERMKLDECLPIDPSAVADPAAHLKAHLGFSPCDNQAELANYARYYRAYPHFSRVIL